MKFINYEGFPRYLAAVYQTTLVSLGEYHAVNGFERFFALVIMLLYGYIMTYSITVLNQIVVSLDQSKARLEEKMEVLDRIYQQYQIPLELYTQLRQSLRYRIAKDNED